MGEYISKRFPNGKVVQIQIGVCTTITGARRSELELWQPQDQRRGTNISGLLKCDQVVYRFPYPDEDGVTIAQDVPTAIEKRYLERVHYFHWSGEHETPIISSIEHTDAHLHVSPCHPADPDHTCVNQLLKIACPNATKTHTPYLLKLVGVRYINDNPVTIFACGYCGNRFYLTSQKELELVHTYINISSPTGTHEFHAEIARRITAKF